MNDTIETTFNQEDREKLISEWIIQLRSDRSILSIKDFAQIIGGVFDDLEIEVLQREINKITLNDTKD
jgi:hypothetical protein